MIDQRPKAWARMPGGAVLVHGSALAEVIRSMQTARSVTRSRDGYGPSADWVALYEDLIVAHDEGRQIAEAMRRARRGSPAVPLSLNESSSDEDLIDVREAAEMLECGERNVRDLLARGVLMSVRRAKGRAHRLDRGEVAALKVRREDRCCA